MKKISRKTESIRQFILDTVAECSDGLSVKVAEHFNLSRQSASRYIKEMVDMGCLMKSGQGRAIKYTLAQSKILQWTYALKDESDEFAIFQNDIYPHLNNLPENIQSIWEYGLTELINNALDHSNGDNLTIQFTCNAQSTTVILADDGVGIFAKIQKALNLPDQRQAVLELAKGKITTDPDNHTGEGIFFSSRLFDAFWIYSNDIVFSHLHNSPEDWILERQQKDDSTFIILELSNHTARTCKEVFDEYAPKDEYAFSKTVVPLRMASFGTDRLISRSQAKRVMANLEKFNTILLDFDGVSFIGQGFADEIFRVYQRNYPNVKVIPINACDDVEAMIARVINTAKLNAQS